MLEISSVFFVGLHQLIMMRIAYASSAALSSQSSGHTFRKYYLLYISTITHMNNKIMTDLKIIDCVRIEDGDGFSGVQRDSERCWLTE